MFTLKGILNFTTTSVISVASALLAFVRTDNTPNAAQAGVTPEQIEAVLANAATLQDGSQASLKVLGAAIGMAGVGLVINKYFARPDASFDPNGGPEAIASTLADGNCEAIANKARSWSDLAK